MGKKQAREQAEAQESLVGDLEQEIEDLKALYEEADQRAVRLARDNDAYRSRESSRMRAEHAEQQRQRKQAERAAALERVEAIRKNLLPLDGAEQVRVTHEDGDTRISVTVKLTEAEARAVHEHYLNRRNERKVNVNVRVFDEVRITDAINKMAADAQRIRDCYSF